MQQPLQAGVWFYQMDVVASLTKLPDRQHHHKHEHIMHHQAPREVIVHVASLLLHPLVRPAQCVNLYDYLQLLRHRLCFNIVGFIPLPLRQTH